MSQGPGEMRGSWNQGENWDFVSDRDKQMAERIMSDPNIDPPTGAELGVGNQTLADGMTVQPGAQPSPGAPKLH